MSQSRGQVNALNRLQNILPCKVKELMYRAFVLPHLYYCSQVLHHCGSRNTKKIEKVNERALRCVYKDKTSAYHKLLQRIRGCLHGGRKILALGRS